MHLLQSGGGDQSVEITLAFKDFQVQVGDADGGECRPRSASTRQGWAPPRAMARCPKRSRWAPTATFGTPTRSPGVYRFSPNEPAARALLVSLPSPAVGCEVSANAVAPTGIVAGPDGALWFTQSNGGNPRDGRAYFPASIGRITTSGAYSSYPVPASASSVPGLDAITVGPNGNLWFTETAIDRIGEITPRDASPVIHEFALPAGDRLAAGVGSPITSADTIAAGPGNDIWFTEQGSNAIGVMSTSGDVLKKFTVPNANLTPLRWASPRAPMGPCGSPRTAPTRSPVSPPRARSRSIPCRALPRGHRASSTGQTATCGSPRTPGSPASTPVPARSLVYRAHTADPSPVGITVGPDCTSIWFTEPSADRLGRVAPVPNTTGCKPR